MMSNWRAKLRRAQKRPALPQLVHTFTVQKPFCSPARSVIMSALQPYGVPVLALTESVSKISIKDYAKLAKIELRTFENLKYGPGAVVFLPLAMEARVTVPAQQAQWAEYLLERTMRLAVTGGRINKDNRRWADQHGGNMPTPWDAQEGKAYARQQERLHRPGQGEAWIESSCKEGNDVWQAVMKAANEAKKKNR